MNLIPDNNNQTIHSLFERQAEKTPDNNAIIFKEERITYKECNFKANCLAHVLQEKGVKRDSAVAIIMERSPDFIIAILAVLKAGAAYLPIDPKFPQERIDSILEDSKASVVLSNECTIKKFSYTSLQALSKRKAQIYITNKRQQIEDLDTLPIPDRTLIDYEKYHKHISVSMMKHTVTIQGTRGCPYNCAYCHKIWPKKHVYRSAEHIFEEIKNCYNEGIRRFVFIDDIFNLNVQNSSKLFKMIIREKLKIDILFPAGLRTDILTKDYIDLMVEAGTINIAMALETASNRLQKLIDKNLNIERFKENVDYITEKYPNLILEFFAMHGFPSETEEEATKTLDFVKQIKWLDFPYIHILKLYPDTDMAKLAVKYGVSEGNIQKSISLGYHELPETLPFQKEFTKRLQSDFLNNYFLSKERLLDRLPFQMKVLTEDELVKKYNEYLPTNVKCFDDLLELVGINRNQIGSTFFDDRCVRVTDFSSRMRKYFPRKEHNENSFRILFLDLSQLFTKDEGYSLFNVVEPPLGHMYLLTYLNKKFGSRIHGKLFKSKVDFDNYDELKKIVHEFKPQMICIRTLTYYRDFFHKTISLLKLWNKDVPIVTGGPYATSSYKEVLCNASVDIVAIGEGEITLCEIVDKFLQNDKKLPSKEVLKEIDGIAFVEDKNQLNMEQCCREVLLTEHLDNTLCKEMGNHLTNINSQDDLVYIIYTSGSTGQPKGVMLEHKNLVNLFYHQFMKTEINFGKRVLQYASPCFDVSFQEVFSTLLSGGELHIICEEDKLNVEKLFEYIKKNNIEVVFFPTSFIKFILNKKEYALNMPRNIRHIITAGEQLIISDELKKVLKEGQIFLHNHYGPTETHVVTCYTIDPNCEIPSIPPIGKPISNIEISIIGGNGELLSDDCVGELCISGVSVGRGYLNDPRKTSEKFIYNIDSKETRMFRTGDLVRRGVEGNIEFIGRKDYQVKIRGYRVELEEIESHIMGFESVDEAAVVACEDSNGDKYLCTYIVGKCEIDIEEIKNWLSQKLPDYMIPLRFIQVKSLPLNHVGKVDRTALLGLNSNKGLMSYELESLNEIEISLKEIWKQVLNLSNIGIHDKFFNLGGHSLKIMVLLSKIYKEFNIQLTSNDIFEAPTIKMQADIISTILEINKCPINKETDLYCAKIDKRPDIIYAPLSFLQEGVWIISQFEKSNRFCIPATIRILGDLNINTLKKAIKAVVDRHSILRTVFKIVSDRPVQYVDEIKDIDIGFTDFNGALKEDFLKEYLLKEARHVFDLENGPLYKFSLLRINENNHTLICNFHHLIFDGYSYMIFLQDVSLFYEKYITGNEIDLPDMPIDYKDFSNWQFESDNCGLFDKEINYWKSKLEVSLKYIRFPMAKKNMNDIYIDSKGKYYTFTLDNSIISKLQIICTQQNCTMFIALCSVFNVLVYRLTGEKDLLIGTPFSGRYRYDMKNLIGFFSNLSLLCFNLNEDTDFISLLRSVKDTVSEALENQALPYEKIINTLNYDRKYLNLVHHILFSYIDLHDQYKEVRGVKFESIQYIKDIVPCNFGLIIEKNDDEYHCSILYKEDLFDEHDIYAIASCFQKISECIVNNPLQAIIDYQIEKEQTVTNSEFEKDFCF